eukprot:4156410-Alexandrium_andersonii.AAC.1
MLAKALLEPSGPLEPGGRVVGPTTRPAHWSAVCGKASQCRARAVAAASLASSVRGSRAAGVRASRALPAVG